MGNDSLDVSERVGVAIMDHGMAAGRADNPSGLLDKGHFVSSTNEHCLFLCNPL